VFKTRWRWNTTISLAVPRARGGRRVAPQVQRMLADDLMAAVFPDAAACLENIPGDRQVPDHPLVNQTVRDCLQEAMDFDGLRSVLGRIHRGELGLVARDTPEPSLFAYDILNAKPYAFLDDAPLEERRTQAVHTRRAGDHLGADDTGALDPDAIDRVRTEAKPDPRDADELHDALLTCGVMSSADIAQFDPAWLEALALAGRVTRVFLPAPAASEASPDGGLYVAAERLPELLALHPGLVGDPQVAVPPSRAAREWTRAGAAAELVRGRLTIAGPTTAAALAALLGLPDGDVEDALLALESEGVVLRGRFSPALAAFRGSTEPGRPVEWCDRALLARIHRYTLNRLRAEIEPVSPADFMRFLFKWQHVDRPSQLTGIDGLREIVSLLGGFELPAGAWERSVLPARMDRYDPSMLDMLCLAGEVAWARLSPPKVLKLGSVTPVALQLRDDAELWQALRVPATPPAISDDAHRVLDTLRLRGASFFGDLESVLQFDGARLRHALGLLVSAGLAVSDGFSGLRTLIAASKGTIPATGRRNFAGRWSALAGEADGELRGVAVERQAHVLLRRYGVMFRRLLTREPNAAPWRELTRVYRRLEARGEIRGGRFVSGMAGEQYALADAVPVLREVRRTPVDGRLTMISTADPLNLTGIVTAGERLRAAGRNRVAYRDGQPVAVLEGEGVRPLAPIDHRELVELTRLLIRRRAPISA
jgi:ATP-dependent Lhr-like helicase